MNRRFAAVAAAVVVLAGCGGPSGTSSSNAGADAGYGTRTVTDCTGTKSTFTAAPTRVAAVTTSVLEFLLRLGLKDKIVGAQAVAPGAFPADLQKIADGLPKLGGEYVPGNFVPVQREQLLSANPDFVVGGWPSNFDTTKGALSQAELAQRHLNSYFALAASCTRTAPVTDLSVTYQDIDNYGTIFDTKNSTDAMVNQMKSTVAEVQGKIKDAPRPKVYSYSLEDGAGKAYAVGNQNLSNAIITQAGGKNIFDDVNAVYQDVSWEEVVARNPDVIVLEAFGKGTQAEFDQAIAKAEASFTGNPALQNVTAVKNRRFVPVLAETYYLGGTRNAEAVAALAKALHPDAFK
ncbi:lipoprotein [Amycolatopsis sp. NBRC 101858]|uniref:ABC transporter substrate-binding protein n=1 Tax=Amycolatopsis sp. NBRC 101858 TaxID=3032200 RepID=UPI0024A15C0B|nr:ABC transporter substrate-binding protein [Amycolatopsis sp. NBRC 101858]GLY42868.1 lipoprotein [Amycolatopsis sp. NBRC 101858]